MNTENFLKNKWVWVIGGIAVFLILVSLGSEKGEVKPTEVSQEQKVEALFPVKQLINKTPDEIKAIIGIKVKDSFKGVGGKIMNASIELNGVSIETAYTLVEHPKVKYNGIFFFNIWFDKPINENEAWNIVGLPKPDKEQAYTHSTNYSNFTWRNISPFFEVQASYPYIGNTLNVDKNKIEFIECYLLPEEDMSLYPID